MAHSRLTVILADNERQALQCAAERDLRPLGSQARYLLRSALQRRGLLTADADGVDAIRAMVAEHDEH